jgi:hypothetical protein
MDLELLQAQLAQLNSSAALRVILAARQRARDLADIAAKEAEVAEAIAQQNNEE